MRKPTFCICENNDADQLCGNRKADQRLCFRNRDITIPLHFKPLAIFCSCIAWFVSDQVGNQNVCFLMTRLIHYHKVKPTSSIRRRFVLYLRMLFSTCSGRSSGRVMILSNTSAGNSGIISPSCRGNIQMIVID